MGSHLDVQPEVLFSQQGATFDAFGADSAIKTDYLVAPILVRYKLNSIGPGSWCSSRDRPLPSR